MPTLTKMKLLSCLFSLMLTIPTLPLEVKILNTPDGISHPPPCALTCSGISKHSDTGNYNWRSYHGQAYKENNITGCGFVSPPVVTAILKGYYMRGCPSVFIELSKESWFVVQTVEGATAGQMTKDRCDVYWTANGFNC